MTHRNSETGELEWDGPYREYYYQDPKYLGVNPPFKGLLPKELADGMRAGGVTVNLTYTIWEKFNATWKESKYNGKKFI